MKSSINRRRARLSAKRASARKNRGGLACAVLVAAALSLPASAAATPATGSLYFAKPTAKLVGDTALVPVQCVGMAGSVCNGEISVEAAGLTSESPFSVSSGGNRIVSVPVTGLRSGESVVATAKTVGSSGSYLTATEVIRLR